MTAEKRSAAVPTAQYGRRSSLPNRRPDDDRRRTDLQGMRAIAVLVVFADHLFDWPSGGFVGVDVFFVLSGFFISGLLIRERTTTGALSFKHFYVRRVKRIVPSASLVLVVTVIGSYLLLTGIRAKQTLVDALYAAVFAANFRFQAIGADYFQRGQPPSPLQHYWSLSIEEQFYFVWPAVIVLTFAVTHRRRRGGSALARQWGLFGVMAVVVAGSFAGAMFFTVANPNAAYFSTLTRIWELGVGALVAISGPWLARIPSVIRPALAYLGIAGVLASLFVINSTVQFPAPWAALPVLSTALVIASFHGVPVHGVPILTNPVARWFGDTSYTLYLWHWPVIILLMAVLPKGPAFYCVALVLALVLTTLTYYCYEDPIRKSEWLIEKPVNMNRRIPAITPPVWAAIGGATVAVVVISILGVRYHDELIAAGQGDQPLVVESAAPPSTIDPCFGAPAMVTQGCVMRDPTMPLRPGIDGFANDAQGAYVCFRQKGEELKSCTYGYKGDDAIRIALVGDSHGAMLLPALVPNLLANKWQLTTYLGYDCELRDSNYDCADAFQKIRAKLLAQPYDLVLTTSSREYGGEGASGAAAFRSTWDSIVAAGNKLAVLADNPATSEDSIACLTRISVGGDKSGECGTPRAEALAHEDALVAASRLVPGVTLIDLTRYYCTTDRCPSVIGNVIVYRDAGVAAHVTATWMKTLAPAIVEGIRSALGPSLSGANPSGPSRSETRPSDKKPPNEMPSGHGQ